MSSQRAAILTVETFSSASGWQAHLTLGFQRHASRTVLGQRTHQGPLQVQRPFYPEGPEVCHIAILHPPGGVVGGDQLRIEARIDAGAHALMTTPAAGKFYRSAGPLADQIQHLTVAAGAALEWLPQENIFYSGARVDTLTQIELQGDACFLGWEITCLGRPAASETFATGECRQTLELWRDGEPLYLERARYAGGDPILNAAWGLRGQPVSATLLCAPSKSVSNPTTAVQGRGAEGLIPAMPELMDAIRAAWKGNPLPSLDLDKEISRATPNCFENELATVTQLDDVLICRYLGPSAGRARQFFILAWGLLRPMMLNRLPCPSRFWNT